MSSIEHEKYEEKFLMRVYRKMLEARIFDEKLLYLFSIGNVPGTTHSGIGQEAIPVGISEALRKDDYLLPSHQRTVKQAETWWFTNDASRFLMARANSPKDTFVQYRKTIQIVYRLSFAGGVVVVVYLVFFSDILDRLYSLGLQLVLKLCGITI